jgi:hypothetical protein
MVWQGTENVGFGVHESKRLVIAWYCNSKATGGTEAYKVNIKKDCTSSGYNKCFNADALKRLVVLRKYHEATNEIKLDAARSEVIQTVLNTNNYVGGSFSTGDLDSSCVDAWYEEKDPAKLPTLSLSDISLMHWYSGKKFWDFKKGKFERTLQKSLDTLPASTRT